MTADPRETTGAQDAAAFTVIVCKGGNCAAATDASILRELRATIRRCPHGVLMSSECPLGALCREQSGGDRRSAPDLRAHHVPVQHGARTGTILIVQRCTTDERRPVGSAILLGPIRARADLATISDWLVRGDLDAATLPARLFFNPGRRLAHSLN